MRSRLPLVIRAEQALLGAVLSDPAGQARLLDLVEPDDMSRPYHGQVLAALQRLRGSGVAPGPLAVYEEIKKDPDMPRGLSHDGVLLAGLMEAAPRSDHAPSYAGMVAGSGIRRRIALAASRMTQAADSQDLKTALDMTAEARREIEHCQARWGKLPAPMRRELQVPGRSQHSRAEMIRLLAAARDEIRRLRQDLLAGTRQGLEERRESLARHVADVAAASTDHCEQQERARATAEARPGGAAAQEAGMQALRDLAADPSQIRAVQGWLKPGHFVRPEQGELYAVMRDMADTGLPVDPVTVSWEASRRGIDADPANLADGTAPLAVASAREVHRHGLLAQIASAGRDIQASADNRRLAPGLVLRSAGDRLRQLDHGPQPDGRRQDDWQPRDRQPLAEQAAEAEAGAA